MSLLRPEVATYYSDRPKIYKGKEAADWRDRIKVGDVLYEGGDPRRPRMVREVSYFSKKRSGEWILGSVSFTILHRSWTGRCCTTINRYDLKQRKFAPAGVTIKTCNEFCQEIGRNIYMRNHRTLTPEDVKGIR